MSRGRFTHYLSFYSPIPTTDGAGQVSLGYVLSFNVRGDFLIRSSVKGETNLATPGEMRIASIRIPYNRKVRVDWRVSFEGTTYEIRGIRDPDGRRVFLDLEAEIVDG